MKFSWRKTGWIAGTGISIYGFLFYLLPLTFSLPEGIGDPPEKGLVFEDRNGAPLRRMLTDGGLRVDPFVPYRELPQHLIEATVAAEDQRFFSHGGIDLLGVGRAVLQALEHRRVVSGASTITQQLVKISSPPRNRDFRTKLVETGKARKLELQLSKQEILAAYLNRLPYGNQLTGCRAAARRYFGKPVSDLSLAECAFLAGLPNKPSRLNPYRNLAGARVRQHWVLKRMWREKFITRSECDLAISEPLALQPANSDVFHAPHFVELFLQENPSTVEAARSSGNSVETSIDLSLQDFVETCVTQNLGRIASEQFNGEKSDLQAAVVVIDNPTGQVLALTGSSSFFDSTGGQINGAWTPRSPGSTLKPFTYVLALEKGYPASTILPDIPVEYVSAAGSFNPVNFDRKFNGPVTMRKALATSLNVPAVKMLNQVGGPRVLHQLMARDLRFTSLNENGDSYGLGLTIGNAETRLLELTNAYASLARLGVWKPYRFAKSYPVRSETQQGTVDDHTLFSRENAWIMADILSDNDARASAFGFDSALRFPYRVAAKTGTSTDFRDNWTVGFTPDYTVGVWLGRFDNRPLPNRLTGALGAGPVFHDIITHLYRDSAPPWYPIPDGIERKRIDCISGKLVPAKFSISPRRTADEYFVEGVTPDMAVVSDYSIDGKNILPLPYASWFRGEGRRIGAICQLEDRKVRSKPDVAGSFKIVSPMNGTTAYLDPDLPSGGQRFPLRIEGNGEVKVEWTSESLEIETRDDRSWVILKQGTHQVEAVDRVSGEKKVTRIVVEVL